MRASGSRPAAGVDGDSVLLRRAARPPANVSGREQSDERFRTPFELWESPRADVPKRDPAGVRLHAEEAGAEIRGARLASCRVGVGERAGLVAVQADGVLVTGDLDLQRMPGQRRQRWGLGVGLLAGAWADGDPVDGAGAVQVEPVGDAACRVAPRLVVELDLEAGVDRDEGLVVVHGAPGRVGGVGDAPQRVSEAHEDPGVLVAAVDADVEPEREVGEVLGGVVQEPQGGPGWATIIPSTSEKLPPPTGCQRAKVVSVPSNSAVNPASTAGGAAVGSRHGPNAIRLPSSWKRPMSLVTEAVGSSPIHRVPASWRVELSGSRRWSGPGVVVCQTAPGLWSDRYSIGPPLAKMRASSSQAASMASHSRRCREPAGPTSRRTIARGMP